MLRLFAQFLICCFVVASRSNPSTKSLTELDFDRLGPLEELDELALLGSLGLLGSLALLGLLALLGSLALLGLLASLDLLPACAIDIVVRAGAR